MSEDRPVNKLFKTHYNEMLERRRKAFELEAMVEEGLPLEWAMVRAEERMQQIDRTMKGVTD